MGESAACLPNRARDDAMSHEPSDLTRHALSGPTMGARWSALFHMPKGFDAGEVERAMAAAVGEVNDTMSPRRPGNALARLNGASPGEWVDLPAVVMEVLGAGLAVGRACGGAFDIGMGDAVSAWGFSAVSADPRRIRTALEASRRPAHEILELDPANRRARKHAPLAVDLCAIAKGYGVDRLAEVAKGFGIAGALVAIDGELRAVGTQPDGRPWTIAIERPDFSARAPFSVLTLSEASVATSGDYRHFIEIGGRRFSHTMDPRRGAPLKECPASVTVVAPGCMIADAWATAMMVLGRERGAALARSIGLSVLFLEREGRELVRTTAIGPAFTAASGDRAQGRLAA